MKYLHYLLALLMITGIMSCSDNGGDPVPGNPNNPAGTFEVSLSGDINRGIEGESGFLHAIVTSQSAQENGSFLTITLFNEDDQDEFINILIGQLGDLNGIDVGSYTVDIDGDDETGIAQIGGFFVEFPGIFLSESGTLNITEVRDNRVRGNFSVQMTDFNGHTVTCSGEFSAVGVTERL